MQLKVDKLFSKSQKRRCWEDKAQPAPDFKRSCLLSHLAETDNAGQPLKHLGHSLLPQQQLQRCSSADAATFLAAKQKKEESTGTAATAACPICGLELPLLTLQQHVAQELSAATDDDSMLSMPPARPEQQRQSQSHTIQAGSENRYSDASYNKAHRERLRAQPPPSALYKAQKVFVLGGDHASVKPSHAVNRKRNRPALQMFNHYDSGAGTWDSDMLGLEAEAAPATTWHGHGTVSLGK